MRNAMMESAVCNRSCALTDSGIGQAGRRPSRSEGRYRSGKTNQPLLRKTLQDNLHRFF